MGKNKLQKFAEMAEFKNVYEYARVDCFDKSKPLVLELGCGHGEYTVGLAEMCADKNFIGVDIKGARMWSGAKYADNIGLKNAAFLRVNIEFLPQYFNEDEVSEVWITFPDPQMKKATKRLTSSYFLKRYQQIMIDGGIINLKTDSPFLYTYTSALVHLNELDILAETDDLYGSDLPADIFAQALGLKTHYERQWLDRGMTIKYISFHLPKHKELIEPQIEIEKDTYRSYGRNYVSSTNN